MVDGKFVAEMLLDHSSFTAYIIRGPVSWYDGEDKDQYRCEFCDPETFPKRMKSAKSEIPFKYINPENLDDHGAASEGFIRASRAGHVKGDPVYIVQVSMPVSDFMDSLARGQIAIYSNMETVAFCKAPTQKNFPNIVVHGWRLNKDEAGALLQQAFTQKPFLRDSWESSNRS